MDERLSQIESARRSITRVCKKLSWVFSAFFAVYCLVVVVITLVAVFPPVGYSYVGPGNAWTFLPIACNVFAGGFAIIMIARMLRVIGKGKSPFSLSSSRQIKALAIVLLVGVVAAALVDPGTRFGSESATGFISFDFRGSNRYDSVYIDFRGLLLSVICFALSPIFRYGALLQSEADDLM